MDEDEDSNTVTKMKISDLSPQNCPGMGKMLAQF
jgi:hypothetical protein